MSTASLVMICISVLTTAAGLPCCMGCVNWAAVPFSLLTVAVGLVGLATDKRPDGKVNDPNLHLAAVIVGALCAVIGAARCTLGSGMV
jgi:hypothetical protein